MSNLLNFKLTIEDLLGPKVSAAIQQVKGLRSEVERPMKPKLEDGQFRDALGKLRNANGRFVKGANEGMSAIGKSANGVGSILGKLGVAFGIFEAFSFLKDSVSMFGEAEQAGAQFEATLKSTGGTVGLTRKELLGLSDELMGKSLFDDDALTQAQSVLLTFTNVKGAIYKEALPAITDLATKMGGDLQGATVQVGKALNDPIKGITALSRVGVSFSESQKATIKNLVETGQTAKAQALILKELGTEFGGSAEAAASAGTGGWTVLKNKFDNVRETLGGLLAQGTGQGLPILTTLVDQSQQAMDWIGEHLDGIKAAFAPLWDAVQPLVDVFQEIRAELYGSSEAGDVLATVFNTIGAVVRFISPAIKIAATLIADVYRQVFRVVKVIGDWLATSPRVQKFLVGLWEGAVAVFKGIAQAAGKFLGGVGGIIEGVFTGNFGKIKDGLKQTLTAVADTNVVSIGMDAAKGFQKGYKKGFEKTDLFGVKNQTTGAGSDAATDFLNKGSKAGAKAPAMTAGASKEAGVSGAGGGAKVINITLNANNPFRDSKFYVNDLAADARSVADQFRDWMLSELNDVNTIASTL
jgi:hypothetical protein